MTNSFGKIFKFTTWGESHADRIGCVVDGVPPLIDLNIDDIQYYLNKRRPGSNFTSPRNEEDLVSIESGVLDGKTTGAPISLMIKNTNHNSSDYNHLKNIFRPGHADFTYYHKYGIWDHRGGGRASARETAMRVAAGAIARKILPKNIIISAILRKIGKLEVNKFDWEFAKTNELYCPDRDMLDNWRLYLQEIKEHGNSVGAIIECKISNVPVGLGEPVYNKLDAALASAIMSINAVKAVEIGDGFSLCDDVMGSNINDQIYYNDGKIVFSSNHAGGILGGISTGQDIILRFVVKPTSSTAVQQNTINTNYEDVKINVGGRHDPCVGIRAVVVAESMIACVLADHYLLNKCIKL